MTQQQPDGFMTALSGGMAQMHELFSAMCTAGFTEHQALTLISGMMSEAMQQAGQECPHCGKPMNG